MEQKRRFEVEEPGGIRIDRYLSEQMPELSRSYVQKLIKDKRVLISGNPVKANYKVAAGDVIELKLPSAAEPEIQAEDLLLDILYEDADVIFINKPKDMVVHPSAGHATGTLVNGLLYHCQGELSGINGVIRPGIVHRIDKDTTGVIIVCKNDQARLGRFTYIECQLETGRTHQIRVHMASIGHPLLGDEIYGRGKSLFSLQGQALHAMVLGVIHPSTGKYLEVEAPLPEYFLELLGKLRRNNGI